MSKLDELIQQLCPVEVEWKPLGEVCEFRSGWGFPESEQGNKDGKYPFYKVADMNNSALFMDKANNYISEEISRKIKCKPAPKGTIIFPKIGATMATNKKRILTQDSCYDNNIMGLVSNSINTKFLFYYFSQFCLLDFAKGIGAVPSLDTNKLKKLEIPLPPLPVQEEIVRLLDLLTETTQKYQAELEAELDVRKKQYEEYRNQLLDLEGKEGVEMKMLGEVCDKTTNIKWKNISEDIVFKYIDLSSVNVENNSIESVSDINKTIAPSRAQQLVQTEDVILGTTRPTLKRFCVITESYNGQICSTGYCIYRAKKHIVNFKWIYHNIGCTKFWDYCEAKQQGAGYPCLSNADAMAYKISIPPLTEQERIVNILDRMEKTHKELCQSIETEIRMRKQQYEYYRNQLLDFKKKKE